MEEPEPSARIVAGKTPEFEEFLPKSTEEYRVAIRDDWLGLAMKPKDFNRKTLSQILGGILRRQTQEVNVFA